MLEWVCPICDRAVAPGFEVCPFCAAREATGEKPSEETKPASTRKAAKGSFSWLDVERGFRFGLGFVAVLALAYFLAVLAAYIWGKDELFYRLLRWLRWR